MIGESEFVRKAIEEDKCNRLKVGLYIKRGKTVHDVVVEIGCQLKIDIDEIKRRGRTNNRSKFRKIVAAYSHRILGIPISAIALYYGVENSSVSRMLAEGEHCIREMKIKTTI